MTAEGCSGWNRTVPSSSSMSYQKCSAVSAIARQIYPLDGLTAYGHKVYLGNCLGTESPNKKGDQ